MISIANTCLVGSAAAAPPEDVAHITSAIADAQVRTEPFAYATIENFLPSDLFDGLRAMAESGTGPGWQSSSTRSSIYLAQSFGEPEGATDISHRAVAVLSSTPVVEAARRLFADHLDPAGSLQNRVIGLELMYDKPGFMLPPHTDGDRREIGCLIYLADTDAPDTMGTRLYAPIDPTLPERTRNGVNWEEVEEAVAIPYRPNLALLWVRSNRSYHGVPLDAVAHDRRALQWCIEKTAN